VTLASRRILIKDRLHSVQRRLALRICRMASYAAAVVLAGIPPAEYVADALTQTYSRVKAIRLGRGPPQAGGGEGIVTPAAVDRLRGKARRRVSRVAYHSRE